MTKPKPLSIVGPKVIVIRIFGRASRCTQTAAPSTWVPRVATRVAADSFVGVAAELRALDFENSSATVPGIPE